MGEQIYARLKQSSVRRDDFHPGMSPQHAVKFDKISAILRVRIRISKFSQNPFRSYYMHLRITRNLECTPMKSFPRVEKSQKIKCVRKNPAHRLGSPLT